MLSITIKTKALKTSIINSMSRILIIGAGLSGATLAERFANQGYSVLVIDKKNSFSGQLL
jgi:flavin-dependent dehydrogenase